MKCIIGLGNIGQQYDNTRHNIGFMCIDYLSNKYNIKIDKKKTKCIYGKQKINENDVIFVKPTTYMNLSGEAIYEIMNWYKLSLNDILIIYDDIDLPFGLIRYKEKGSAGTHNGMKNIIQHLNSEEFCRIRIGIENRENNETSLFSYVLSKFTKDEIEKIKSEVLTKTSEIVNEFLTRK